MKNPNELYVAQRPNKAFVLSASLYTAPAEEPPLSMPRYSRFGLTIFDKKEDKSNILFANIPAQDVFLIKKKTDIAVERLLEPRAGAAPTVETDGASTGKAFTVSLMDNKFRGKTPGQVIQENPADESELRRIQTWLQANVAKYPRNQEQIDAINDALSMLKNGGTAAADAAAAPAQGFEIYSSEFKYLTSRKDEQGRPLIYQVGIMFEPRNEKSPVSVRLVNYHAPVVIQKGQRSEIQQSGATPRFSATFNMTMAEWYAAIAIAEANLNSFISSNFAQQYAEVMKQSYKGAATA